MKKIGVYIHIPFCMQKCFYCDFISFADKMMYVEDYIDAVKKEFKYKVKYLKGYEVSSIFIGGGTPSYIEGKFIKEILKEIFHSGISVSKKLELSIEVNPGTISQNKIIEYKDMGINRISVGLQTTNDCLLKQIGRIHNYDEFLKNYEIIKQVGISNINVDLMIGLPNQTMDDIKSSLHDIVNLNPNHISVYSLILEDGTLLHREVTNGNLILPDEELERHMYWYVKHYLEENGYRHYEISNFSKEGYESKHNMSCWEQGEYIGLGIAAHSYLDGKRFSNINSIKDYIDNINTGEYEKNIILNEEQNEIMKEKEYMLLGLRKIEGISILAFKNKFNKNPIYVFRNELKELVEKKLIEIDGDMIKLTSKGLDLANIVWEQFI
ncbi:MAG: radical SAM family heme chaperone HemW [Clostridia bacterium]|nr:radical SAM family heme chaperone HemW [Clostridia bacterium]